jgi:hypothetical protein
MSDANLVQLEREVEAARAKLASDLSTLRSPATAAEFTEALKQEAIDIKDAFLDKAKTTVQSSIESIIEDVKARAAANPTAALAIGAGIAWRLLRHPPIATALIGAGLVSLIRTTPVHSNGRATDYFSHARTRLIEQASEGFEAAKEKAVALSETVVEQVRETTGEMKDRVQDLATQATQAARRATTETGDHASAMWRNTKDALGQAEQSARSAASTAMSRAGATIDEWRSDAHDALSNADGRDKLLLSAAGLAIFAALAIACQRRMEEHAHTTRFKY